MAPDKRDKCRECRANLKKGKKRHSGNSLWNKLQDRESPDGIPYDKSDWFCDKCRQRVSPSGKSLRTAETNSSHVLQRNEKESELPFENENVSVGPEDSIPLQESDQMEFEMTEDVVLAEENSLSLNSEDLLGNVQTVFSNSETSIESQEINFPPSQTPVAGKRQIARCVTHAKVFLPNTKSVPYSEKRCCVCNNKTSRSRIPESVQQQFWLECGIWIPTKNRCCPSHYSNSEFTAEAKDSLLNKSKDGAFLNTLEIEDWIRQLTNKAQAKRIDLDQDQMTDKDYNLLFGLSKDNFEDLFQFVEPGLKLSTHRSPKNALAIFLAKLRLGISQKMLGFLFGLPQRKVSATIARTTYLLEQAFVKQNIGFSHKSRGEFLSQNDSEFVRRLYKVPAGCICIILDGTYLYTQKSSDHHVQTSSFSMQKGRNLLKVMVIVTVTGYIVDVVGCYFSNGRHNDAQILSDMFDKEDGIGQFVGPQDVFVLDRGFRDIIKRLNEMGITTLMPELLGKTQRQFTTEEANTSRKVTLTRWVVEAVNGRLKNMFKFFDNVIPAPYFNKKCNSKLNRYLRIACAIMNKYCPPIFQENDSHMELLSEIEKRDGDPNLLMDEVKENESEMVRQTNCWQTIPAHSLTDFPQLSLSQLHKISLGKFNINNAQGYVDAHLRCDMNYNVQLHKTKPGLLKVKVRSKYRSSGSHNLWIRYSAESGQIEGHYCQCKGGAKSLGCCSHVASVLWFLGYQRHQSPSYTPRTFGEEILEIVSRSVYQAPEFGESDSEDDSEPPTVPKKKVRKSKYTALGKPSKQNIEKPNGKENSDSKKKGRPIVKKITHAPIGEKEKTSNAASTSKGIGAGFAAFAAQKGKAGKRLSTVTRDQMADKAAKMFKRTNESNENGKFNVSARVTRSTLRNKLMQNENGNLEGHENT